MARTRRRVRKTRNSRKSKRTQRRLSRAAGKRARKFSRTKQQRKQQRKRHTRRRRSQRGGNFKLYDGGVKGECINASMCNDIYGGSHIHPGKPPWRCEGMEGAQGVGSGSGVGDYFYKKVLNQAKCVRRWQPSLSVAGSRPTYSNT